MSLYQKFAEHYDLIYKEIVNYEEETDAIESLFKKFLRKKPRTVLDVGCGTGTHALLLSKRGYAVSGIDVSRRMIEHARRKALQERAQVEFFVQDMRQINLHKKFDCAICLFGGFGYITDYNDVVKLFSGLEKHLNEHGLFIFEFWSVGGIKPSPYMTWLKTQEKDMVLYRLSASNFDPWSNILNIDFHFIELRGNKPAKTFDETHKVKCYTLPEMRKYLEDNGFKLETAYDWGINDIKEFKVPEKETFRILAVSKKT